MTTEPEPEEDPGAVPYQLADGDFLALDPDFLDTSLKICGVLAIQHTVASGPWVLIGEGDGDAYRQVWKPVGEQQGAKPARNLKPV